MRDTVTEQAHNNGLSLKRPHQNRKAAQSLIGPVLLLEQRYKGQIRRFTVQDLTHNHLYLPLLIHTSTKVRKKGEQYHLRSIS